MIKTVEHFGCSTIELMQLRRILLSVTLIDVSSIKDGGDDPSATPAGSSSQI